MNEKESGDVENCAEETIATHGGGTERNEKDPDEGEDERGVAPAEQEGAEKSENESTAYVMLLFLS